MEYEDMMQWVTVQRL